MESNRRVHISYYVSGEPVGYELLTPRHADWTTFVIALHYYAARVSEVPIWCVQLLWKEDLWDEAQLPMNVYIQCVPTNEMLEIRYDCCDADNRCCNC